MPSIYIYTGAFAVGALSQNTHPLGTSCRIVAVTSPFITLKRYGDGFATSV
jgi:hypothetical protein